ATISVLNGLLPAQATLGNPVDTTAAVDPDTFARCVAAVCADPGVDAVLAATVRTAVGDPSGRLIGVETRGTPLLAVRLGQAATVSPLLSAAGTPVTASYADPADAIRVIGRLAEYARWRAMPISPAPAIDVDVPSALGILREQFRLAPLGGWLDPERSARLLRCFGIPQVEGMVAGDADLAAAMFDVLGGGPVVVKAIADGLLHKTAHGGVLLDLRDSAAVRDAVTTLTGRFGAELRGVQVQPMAPAGRELLVGVHSDGTFGPLVVFGLGGVDTEMLADRAARLAPLTERDADELLHGLRGSAALFGSDQVPLLDIAAIRDVLLRVSLLAEVLPEVVELDLNPLIVWPRGCQVVDARIRTAPVAAADPFLPRLRG
ncbi:MAG TPA: acetate--CoA ligase family protein, partial [Pseudonocardiaceae bacterium]|nr:acetate--CoA ligase family protein [Pseudonocardiaceae bacterium]